MLELTKLTPEAYQAVPPSGIAAFGSEEVAFVEQAAKESSRLRSRILLHKDVNESLHSMLVAYQHNTYVRPNKHTKDESVFVLRGNVSIVFFDDFGTPTRAVMLAPQNARTCLPFFCRLPAHIYHTVLMETDAVLLEDTAGPFDPAQTTYANWGPQEGDAEGIAAFRHEMNDFINRGGCFVSPVHEQLAQGVWRVKDEIATLTGDDVRFLPLRLRGSESGRARICVHKTVDDPAQQMLMAFSATSYIRASRHAGDESLFVLSGLGTYYFPDANGKIIGHAHVGPLWSNRPAFVRVPRGCWHQLRPETDMLVFETCQGPFRKEATEYAPWENGAMKQ